MEKAFAVPTRGVGRLDYSRAIERSTEPFATPALRQDRSAGIYEYTLPYIPWPGGSWYNAFPFPQEDGTWDWEASSIILHFSSIHASIQTNNLLYIRLDRFASWEDWLIYNVAQSSPQLFGYGKVVLDFIIGIPSQEGSVYGFTWGAWPPDAANYDISVGFDGLYSELTAPWMPPY